MLKSSNVYAFSVLFLIVSVNSEFLGIQTKSTKSKLPAEPPLRAEQRTTEGSSDVNYKSTTSSDITIKSSGDISSTEESSVNVKQGISADNQSNNNEGDSTSQADISLQDSDAVDSSSNEMVNGEQENNATDNSTHCGPPPEIEEATTPDLDDELHAVGTVIRYQCNLGYVSRNSGGFPSVCTFNETTRRAEWTKPEISCSPRSCGDPGYVTNGRRIGNLFTFPNKIEFECDEGYKLKGLKSRYCQARGDWSGRRLPTCELINCSEPTNPVNGRVSYSSLGYGSKLRYECNRGFVLKNHVTRVCAADGEWSDKEPDCIEVTCEKPLPPERGSVQFSDGQAVGSLATYLCEEGTTLVGVPLSKCLENGIWTFDPPKCLRSCIIPEIENGAIGFYKTVQSYRQTHQEFVQFQVDGTVKHGISLTVRCHVGFIPVNLTTLLNGDAGDVSCHDGVWSKSMQCAPSRCLGEPPPMENGYPKIEKNINGSTIWYKCENGLEKLKKGHVECVYGTWEGYPPVCGDSRCFTNSLNYPGLNLPKAEIFTSSRSFEISCEEGYAKTSSKKRIQCIKGKWDVESNPCTIIDQSKCEEEPPQIQNGRIESFDRGHGSEVRYRCEENFEILRESSVICNRGKWEGDPPHCQDNRCYTNRLNYPGLKLPKAEYFDSYGSFEISCEEGYKKTSSEKIISCFKGKWEVEINPCTISDESKCEEEPPPIQNGRIEYFDRAHGSEVRYRCDENFEVLRESSVICNRGKWEGDPTQCQEIGQIHNLEIRPVQQNSFDREKHSSTTEAPSSSLHSVTTDTCYCTYDYPDDFLVAYSRSRPVDVKSVIRKGETVSLSCRHGSMEIFWMNGLFFYGSTVNLTCDTCRNWSRSDLPVCRAPKTGDSFLYLTKDMKILPGGILEISRHKNVSFHCINFFAWPAWYPRDKSGTYVSTAWNGGYYSTSLHIIEATDSHAGTYDCYASTDQVYAPTKLTLKIAEFEIQCPLLENNTDRGIFNIQYEKNRTVHSVARYACRSRTQKLFGTSSRVCMPNGKWSGSYPSCEDITCPTINTYNSLVVAYTNDNKVNSRATFRCNRNTKLIGQNSAICMSDGKWSNPKPTCEMLEIRCPALNGKGIFSIYYDNDRKIGSNAAFHCIGEGLKVSGCAFRTCQTNGEWSGDDPTCVDYRASCNLFEKTENLDVFYSNDVKVGSIATFSCVFPYMLVGSHQARCLWNRTWTSVLPSCETPKCTIDSLFQILPEEVSPDLMNVTGDYVPYGTELQLVCGPNFVLSGSSKTKCGQQGRWEHGNVKCTQACILGETALTSQLLVDPVKDYYLFGDTITLSCSPGQKLSDGVQRVMCLGSSSWSPPLPKCVDAPQSNPPNSRKGNNNN